MRNDYTDKFTLYCNCECGSLRIEQFKDDGYTILSYDIPAFFAYQENWLDRLRENVKIIWLFLTGKKYQLFEIIIEDNEELKRFKNFVSQMKEIDE